QEADYKAKTDYRDASRPDGSLGRYRRIDDAECIFVASVREGNGLRLRLDQPVQRLLSLDRARLGKLLARVFNAPLRFTDRLLSSALIHGRYQAIGPCSREHRIPPLDLKRYHARLAIDNDCPHLRVERLIGLEIGRYMGRVAPFSGHVIPVRRK